MFWWVCHLATPSLFTHVEIFEMLKYKGSNYLRQRLVLSTLSSKPTRIYEIRDKEDEPGLKGVLVIVLYIHSSFQQCLS